MKTLNEKDIRDGMNGAKKEDGERILNNQNRIFNLLKGVLLGLGDDVKTMVRLLKAYYAGEYRDIPWSSIAAIIFALGYLLSPLDAIPDMILFIGCTDDAAVITYVLTRLKSDLDAFRQWEMEM
jgi:uncharacterized membrane protein YkvA (DUF1232 family)